MSKYRDLIERCLKEYEDDDPGDKTWTTSSEWKNYYDQIRKERTYKPTDIVRVVCISKRLDDDSVFRKLYIKQPINGFDKTYEKSKAKLFNRYEAEKYIKDHPEKIYPKEGLKVIHEIETL